MTEELWWPASWRDKAITQQPDWPQRELENTIATLSALPPLVFAGEVRELRRQLGNVAQGTAFALWAGDCAESFDVYSADSIRDRLSVILSMAVVLTYAGGMPVVKIGRIAGQYAKPRSQDYETREDVTLPAFRGHGVNSQTFTELGRGAQPERMLEMYYRSAATMNLLRAFTGGGFAAMSRVHEFLREAVADSPQGERYEEMARAIDAAFAFIKASGIAIDEDLHLQNVDMYSSHEALLLDYEEPLCRTDSLTGDWYACSAHLLWIGERTRDVQGAHVEFLSGVGNPIGVKLGPDATISDMCKLAEKLDRHNTPGRLTFVTRMGPACLDAVGKLTEQAVREGLAAGFVCDPMHGNTEVVHGRKTRRLVSIIKEIDEFFQACYDNGVPPGGVHLELTGDDVTECVGIDVAGDSLGDRYETICDPRLNARQALDVAFETAGLFNGSPTCL